MARKEIHQWIRELLKDIANPVIFECGANTGTDTVKLASIPGAVVHAFEPEPRCDLSKMPGNVRVNKMAVSDSNGKAEFNLSDSPGHVWTYSSSLLNPKSHLIAHKHVQFNRRVMVDTITLDDYCREHGIDHIDFLWMDVQGAEGKVFAGAVNILRNTRYIYTEYSNDEMYAGQPVLKELLQLVKTYEIMDIWPVEPSNVLLRNVAVSRIIMVRIDDFPTGVRPVLEDFSKFFRILDEFEKRNINFYLGLIPDTLRRYVSECDIARLKQYKCLVPCQHGYTHRYEEFSEKLMAANDFFNQKTVGTFDEFENCDEKKIVSMIARGRQILETIFEKPVIHYIPVCNIINQQLVNALTLIGFRYVFTPPYFKVNGSLIPITTAHSIKIAEITPSMDGCISLHITWEYDYIQQYGYEKWLERFDRIFGKNGEAASRFDMNDTNGVTFIDKSLVTGGIPKVANFFWNSETPLSYLRYLSFASFRHHHPHWEINLHISHTNTAHLWKTHEKQDFGREYRVKDYLPELAKLSVNIVESDDELYATMAPTYVADIIRWKLISKGGWFFDNDQVFLRPFDDLDCYDLIMGAQNHLMIGVIGASPGCKLVDLIIEKQMELLAAKANNPDIYSELGNMVLYKLFKTTKWMEEVRKWLFWNTPQEVFYPVHESDKIQQVISDNNFTLPLSRNNYAFHWFGGHPNNQVFNSKYTEAFAKRSHDSISVYLKKINVI